MTKFKVCAKIHLFIIISALVIAIGMAVGTICHFCANGFFNYGGEFSSYKSVTVTYYSSEWQESEVKKVCDDALKGFNAYEISLGSSSSEVVGEIVYKFSPKTNTEKLQTAADALNTALNKNNTGLNSASLHEGGVKEGGSRVIIYASIAIASAAAFQFIYFVLRYKLRAAFSVLLANVHNLGIFVALAAITRIPVGTSMVAFGAAVVFFTMILTAILFDRTRKNFANEKYAKSDRLEVVDISACETRMITLVSAAALAIAAVVFGVFACISQLWIGAFAPSILAVFGLIACFYGAVFFTPAVHGGIDYACEKVSSSRKKKDKPAKRVKTEKPTKETV